MARAMGAAGRRRAREVTWRRVVDAMLGRDQGADTPARPDSPFNHFTGRPRIVVLSTYRISGAVFGGPLRCRHLYSGLLPRYDVHIVSLAASGTPRQTVEISRGLVEEVVPLNDAVLAAECAAWPNSDTPITDVAASVFHHLVPQFGETVRRAVRGARGIVLAHPYLYPAIVGVGAGLPVIYDAHNAEFAMKRAMYPPTATGARLAAAVHTVEKAACATAALITPCAEGDADVLAQEFHVPRTHMVIVPNGVDTEAVRFVTTEERRTARERWIAAHSRGTEAAELIMAMAPHMPKVLFVIAGHVCERYRDWSVPTNVALVGIVSEATKNILLGMASVALNPMLQGGGSNLKLMEYMAAGVPVVTTTLGARGAGAEVNKHVVVAEMSDFSEAIESVFATPRATESRVEGARAMVEAHLDWRVLGKQFADAVDATINRADATSDASAAGTIEPMFPPAAVGAEPNSRS